MNYENICISCFRESSGMCCKHCGYIEPQKRRSSVLPARILLNERYLIGEVVNHDKSAIEYKALDTKTNSVVEIQEYFPKDIVFRNGNSENIVVSSEENFQAYSKNLQTIKNNAEKMFEFSSSPNIVNVYDCFAQNNTVYIVKEYIEGMLLSDFLDQNGGTLDCQTATAIMGSVLDGLSLLHKAGLVHRALTPRSIILTTDNKVKISDFRFLKEASPYKAEDMTVHFTPGYAPPEQYRTKSKQGSFSDIYSVGAILYKLLTGQKPADALNRMSEDVTVNPQALNPEIPDNVSMSIVKAMNMVTELRFKTASDFKKCLTEKKNIVDIDTELQEIKRKKFANTLLFAAVAIIAVVGIVMYKLLS